MYGIEIVPIDEDIEFLKTLTDEELMETYKYYKPRAKILGRAEHKYLVAIEREMTTREVNRKKERKHA